MSAVKIIRAFMDKGHLAFFVGGCVRDVVLGKTPTDFDIATSANSSEIIEVAAENGWKTVLTGQIFGVVIIIIDGHKYETASFRSDTYGDDSHRPLFVKPASSIYADLARRDFTVNAMAMDVYGNITDPFDGIGDLKRKIIRAVGNAGQRFAEDGLRMFRAVSFAARFNFEIEPATFSAISQNLSRVRGLSTERVLAEIEKILMSDNPAKGMALLVKAGLAGEVCRNRSEKKDSQVHILPELKYLRSLKDLPADSALNDRRNWREFLDKTPKNIILRWASLLYSIAESAESFFEIPSNSLNKNNSCPGDSEKYLEQVSVILERLKVNSKQARSIVWLLKNYLKIPPVNLKSVTEWLGRTSKDFSSYGQMRKALVYFLLLARAGYRAGVVDYVCTPGLLAKTISRSLSSFVFFSEQLAVSGKIIAAKLGQGKQVKEFQLEAPNNIQKGLLKNTAADLMAELDKRVQAFYPVAKDLGGKTFL